MSLSCPVAPKGKFKCGGCGIEVARKYDLGRHWEECHEAPKTCSDCPFHSQREGRLVAHMRAKKHGIYSSSFKSRFDSFEGEETTAVLQSSAGVSNQGEPECRLSGIVRGESSQLRPYSISGDGNLSSGGDWSNQFPYADEPQLFTPDEPMLNGPISRYGMLGLNASEPLNGFGPAYGLPPHNEPGGDQLSMYTAFDNTSTRSRCNRHSRLPIVQGGSPMIRTQGLWTSSGLTPTLYPPTYTDIGAQMGSQPSTSGSHRAFPVSPTSLSRGNRILESSLSPPCYEPSSSNSRTALVPCANFAYEEFSAFKSNEAVDSYPASTTADLQDAPPMACRTSPLPSGAFNVSSTPKSAGQGGVNEFTSLALSGLPHSQHNTSVTSQFIQQGSPSSTLSPSQEHKLPQATCSRGDASAGQWWYDNQEKR